MKRLWLLPLLLALLAAGCSAAPDVQVDGDTVRLATGDLDVEFAKDGRFEDTYMVFGGTHIDHHNAIVNVVVAGLSLDDARPIARRYPDFHRCASEGAALAQGRVAQLNVLSANGRALSALKDGLDDFEANVRNNGDRVCLRLKGSRLRLQKAQVREVDADVTGDIQFKKIYLVDSADRVECRKALGA